MTDSIPAHRHSLKRGTAAAATADNPVLAAGEEGYETDTGLRKVGDGVTAWNDLDYVGGGGGGGAVDTVAGVSPVSGDVPEAGLATALAVPAPSSTTPRTLQPAGDAGTGTAYSRYDHAHRMPTPTEVGAAATTHTHAESDVTSLATDLAAKAPLASPALTGNPTAPTPTAGDNDTSIATTGFVHGEVAAEVTRANGAYAPLAGPFAPSSTGAASATRYVGGTASGPPTTGTFAVGDYVVTQDGKIYVCVSAGTPGTWRRSGSGFILASGVYTSSTDPTAVTADLAFHDVDTALRMTIPANVPFVCEISGITQVTQGTVAAAANLFQQLQVVDVATGLARFCYWLDLSQFASASGSGKNMSRAVFASDEQAALGADTPVKLQAAFQTNLTGCKLTTNGGVKPILIRAVAR